MTAKSPHTRKTACLRLVACILIFILFWVGFALILHPIDYQALESTNLLPGGERVSRLGFFLSHTFNSLFSFDTLARLCLLF